MKLLNLLSEIEINKPGYELINKEDDNFSFKGSKKAILNLVKSWIIEEPDNWGYYIIDNKIYDYYGQPQKNIQKGDLVSEKPDEYLWDVLNSKDGLGGDYIIKQN